MHRAPRTVREAARRPVCCQPPRGRAALRGMHGLSVRLVCRVQLADGPAAGQGFKLTRTRKWNTKMSASKHG